MRKNLYSSLFSIFFLILSLCLGSKQAHAQDGLVADISDHLIAITTGFTGADVLLFGAVEEDSAIVVTIRGAEQDIVVRRKSRVGGIWINSTGTTFTHVPSFYTLAATAPLENLAPDSLRERHQIGLDKLILPQQGAHTTEEAHTFREALIRLQQQRDRYSQASTQITFIGQRLFRVNLHFPANLPTGQYLIEVFQIKDGEVKNVQTTPLIVSQVGTSAEIQRFAYRHSILYGLIAVAVAIVAGLLGALIFRKV
ncbi:MAG: TIGR02186 family protein [Alphaproteobacteria bacterium]